ncbi:30S ribosomal protein S27ae [Candidatus Woesearchaeota archaeon CG10_big_fil_rev_8_21_14_0_10_34_8]|nr:MAG: 30S ribosomal protein S27ae [Candidatus Woesearchaeota archaeon CG10_big_fil_rev_8_21_14_0_10_34_8]
MAKKPKGKKHPAKLWKAYKVEGNKVTRVKQFSPKAQGSFMAEHKDRRTCGKTGYMERKGK